MPPSAVAPNPPLLQASPVRQQRSRTSRRQPASRPNTALVRALFTALAAGLDTIAIIASAVLAGALYGQDLPSRNDLLLGGAVAGLVVLLGLQRRDYTLARHIEPRGHVRTAMLVWHVATVSALALGFMTKTSSDFSRGTAVCLYLLGGVALCGVRLMLARGVRAQAAAGQLSARRIFLVGDETMIRAFKARHDPDMAGLRVVGASVLRIDPETKDDDLALAAAAARVLRPDDIYILVPWSDREILEACVDTFLRLPAAIHLSPERFFDQFDDLHVVRSGPIASIHLVRRPLSPVEVAIKRALDIALSGLALVLLAPLFALLALAIKLDSPGPVFFRQRRYGFNQEPFRILKFRSMRTLEDDARLVQARRGDSRITRLGRFLRRTNLDELPQLVNVLTGDMSLVGPRPHALAHDQAFEREVALYARRHNVRPGITGWAQVNGWRGETDTPEKVRGRVEHDLYYIDHWSLMLDVSILFRTLFSRRAYSNAG